MILPLGNQIDKISDWSLSELLKYVFFKIYPSRKFEYSPSCMSNAMATSTTLAIGTANPTNTNGIERLRLLEALFLGGPISAHEAKCFSTETLLDVLLVLFSECHQSSLRKEKTVTEFIDLGKCI